MTIRKVPPLDFQRQVLGVLGRDRLAELSEQFEVPVRDRRVAAQHVEALVSAPAGFHAILEVAQA